MLEDFLGPLIGKVCIRGKWPIRPELIPVSLAWSDWEYFYSPLDGMLVHRRVTPSIKFAGTHLYTWVERGTVRVKCLAQEHNTVSPARARVRSASSGVERANHEATVPPFQENFDLARLNHIHNNRNSSKRIVPFAGGVSKLATDNSKCGNCEIFDNHFCHWQSWSLAAIFH